MFLLITDKQNIFIYIVIIIETNIHWGHMWSALKNSQHAMKFLFIVSCS